MEENANLKKLFDAIDKALTTQKIKFKKVENDKFSWVLFVPLKKGEFELNVNFKIIDKVGGNISKISVVFGDMPAVPKEQWAMFLRLLQMNNNDTFEGRFAIDDITNELIFVIVHDTEILLTNLGYFLEFTKHVYEDLRPKAIGFIN